MGYTWRTAIATWSPPCYRVLRVAEIDVVERACAPTSRLIARAVTMLANEDCSVDTSMNPSQPMAEWKAEKARYSYREVRNTLSCHRPWGTKGWLFTPLLTVVGGVQLDGPLIWSYSHWLLPLLPAMLPLVLARRPAFWALRQ